MRHRVILLAGLAAILAGGCRRDDLPFDDGTSGGTDDGWPQRLSFRWTGIPDSYRVYDLVRATISEAAATITIETQDDSILWGRLQIHVRGGGPGTYRYSVTGSAADTSEVFIRFVSQYVGGLPAGEFLLTGLPVDSLEAEVTISSSGAVGDTVSGFFTATLAQPGGGGARILMYDGAFIARRTK